MIFGDKMRSKKILSAVIAMAIFASFCTDAFAARRRRSSRSKSSDALIVSAGIPYSYKPSDTEVKVDGKSSGVLLHLLFPISLGVGYERYNVPIKTDGKHKVDLNLTLYDVFYKFPFSSFNFAFGLGTGGAEITCKNCSDLFKKGSASQVYAQLGILLGDTFDVHMSYHKVNSVIKPQDAYEGIGDTKVGGTMMGLGINIGF
jgi:hypothetical protein